MKNTFLSVSFLIICLGSFAQSEVWRHSDTLGGIYGAQNIHTDVNGYLYVGGPARDSLDTINAAQQSAALVFKLDNAGNYYWNNGFINDFEVKYDGMTGDNAGNNYLYGEYYTDTREFFNGFLARVDSSGDLHWIKHYDYEYYYDEFNSASVDNNGNILVAATSSDSFGNQELINFKFSPADSTPLWSNRYIETSTFYNNYFAQTDNNGGSYNVGQGYFLTFNGINSIVLIKYNSIGSQSWLQFINSTVNSDEEPVSGNTDASGNLYIADNSAPNADNYVFNADDDNYVPYAVKVNATGSTIWQYLANDTGNNYKIRTSALDANYFYMAGQKNDSIFIMQLSTLTGKPNWNLAYGAPGSINKIALKNGAVYVAGSLSDTIGSNWFTAKLTTDGFMQWYVTYRGGQNATDQAFDLVADNSGNIYVAGQSFETGLTGGSATVIKYHDDKFACTLSLDSVVTTTLANAGGSNGVAFAAVSGGTGPYTYLWNTNATSDTITGLGLGNYCVTVTDANGCKDALCGNIVVSTCRLEVTDVSVSYISACYPNVNGAITITGADGIGTLTYSVDTGNSFQADNTIGNLPPGSYYVEVKDAGNCISAYQGNPVIIAQAIDTPALVITGDTLTTTLGYNQYLWYWNGSFLDINKYVLLSDSICGHIYAQVTDSNGCIYVSGSIDIACEGITNVGKPELSWNVYPNPFGERFNVSLDGTPNVTVEVALFDICGQQLYIDRPVSNTFSIPTSWLAQGMYLLRLQAGEQFLYKQVIKAGE